MPNTADELNILLKVDSKSFLNGLKLSEAELRKFERFVNRTGGSMAGFGSSTDKSGGSLLSLGKYARGAAAGLGVITAATAGVVSAHAQQEQRLANLQAQLGITAQQAEVFNDVALELFRSGWAQDIQSASAAVTDAARRFREASSEEIQEITANALALEKQFKDGVGQQLAAVQTLTKEFGLTSQQAFDFIAKGYQNGLNKGDDFLESITEYSLQFSEAGADAAYFFNILEQGAQNGVLGTDKAADAFKEFRARVLDGSKSTSDALNQIGLNADAVAAQLRSGNLSVAQGFQLVIQRLRETDDASLRMQAGFGLLGSQFEDLGDKATTSLDPAKRSLEDLEGGMAAVGAANDTLSNKFDRLTNNVASLTTVIGESVLGRAVSDYAGGLLDDINYLFDQLVYTNRAAGAANEAAKKALEQAAQQAKAEAEAGLAWADVMSLSDTELSELYRGMESRVIALQSAKDAALQAVANGAEVDQLALTDMNLEIDSLLMKLATLQGMDFQMWSDADIERLKSTQGEISRLERELETTQKTIAANSATLSKQIADRKISENERAVQQAKQSLDNALKLEQQYAQRIIALRKSIADEAESDEQRLREIRRRQMSEAAQQADIEKEAQEKIAEARRIAAQVEAGELDAAELEKAKALTENAKQLAESLGNAAKAEALFTQASEAGKTVSEQQLKALQDTQAQIQDIAKGSGVKLDADTTDAESKIAKLQAQIAALKDKTITIRANVQTTEAFSAGGVAGFSSGGQLPGYGGGDTVPALLEPGEIVIKKSASSRYKDLLLGINYDNQRLIASALAKLSGNTYNAGGLVGAAPSLSASAGKTDTVNINLQTPGGERITLMGERQQAAALGNLLRELGRGR